MIIKRDTTIVKASQPEFVALVAVGCLLVSSAILPLSVEGPYKFNSDFTADQMKVSETIALFRLPCAFSLRLTLSLSRTATLECRHSLHGDALADLRREFLTASCDHQRFARTNLTSPCPTF